MKGRNLFLKGIITAVVILLLFTGGRWFFFNIIQRDNVIDGMVELRLAVMDAMEEGKETSLFFVKNIEKEDVKVINEYVDSAFGNVDSYRIFLESGDYLAIQLNYTVSDNYYVIRKFLHQEEIPSDRTKAQEIYDVIDSFMETYIQEPMTDFDKELAVHDYLVRNCVYGFPEEEEDAYEAYGVLVKNRAVCDGYAEAFFLLMSCLDIECDIVVGYADATLHAWNQVKLDGNWYNVDLTWDDSLPDMGSKVKHTYFNVSDESLSLTHSWQEQYYHTCNVDTYNYYVRRFAYYESFEEAKTGLVRQAGQGNVLEVAISSVNKDSMDLSFLYSETNVRSVTYVIEKMGKYTVIVVYTNM